MAGTTHGNSHPNGRGGHSIGELVNGKFLTGYAGMNTHRHQTWWWRCARCGHAGGPTTIGHMTRGKGRCTHCGRSHNWKGHEEISGTWLSMYRVGAEQRGHTWSVDPEYLWKVWLAQDGRCAYTGWELAHGESASLDRIDSSIGYEVGNVQWLHKEVNWMKGTFAPSRFLEICSAVAKRGDL